MVMDMRKVKVMCKCGFMRKGVLDMHNRDQTIEKCKRCKSYGFNDIISFLD